MLNRDSLVWWLVLVASLIGYLIAAQVPPWQWTYMAWLQFLAAFIGWLIGYLQGSPLAGANTPPSDKTTGLLGMLSLYKEKR